MSENESESQESMQNAAVGKIEEVFRLHFRLESDLPAALAALDRLSMNFYWSWHPDSIELFRDLDPGLWEKSGQNPRVLLKSLSDLRLWQKAADEEYLRKLEGFSNEFESYMAASRGEKSAKIAYFCAEYGVHNSLPNYSGGLGILAGDHLKSASDLNIPLVAVGLLYRYGYFRQDIAHDGLQLEHYNDLFESELALTPVLDENGERVMVMVHIRGREVFAAAWLARVGRISLYLLDTNLPQNSEIDRLITGHLYGGDTETRIVQEKILGIAGVRLLEKLGISPDVYHLNEGHSAFLTLELARQFLESYPEASFVNAIPEVRKKCVFTTHTPVAAGNDVFSPAQLRDCFDTRYIAAMKLTEDEFFELGRIDQADKDEPFGMTPLALRMCRSANGVSQRHGEISRGLWQKMFPDGTDIEDVPITHITNGVHAETWIAPLFQRLYEHHFGPKWTILFENPTRWAAAVNEIPDVALWETHLTLKNMLIAFIRERTRAADIGGRDTINEHTDTRELFSAEFLTIGFARRVAAYKRWNLLLTDVERLLRMVDDANRPVQFVFAGKAHPQDRIAKQILQDLMSINHDSKWQKRAVFIENYDQDVARYLVRGVDVWLNVPQRPHEASGTSGMKAAMNGVLNFSVLDGWWIEGYNGKNGFIIPDPAEGLAENEIDSGDAESLYSILENDIIPLYYQRDGGALPREWIDRMRNAMATLTPQFCSDRMLMDYVRKIYKIG